MSASQPSDEVGYVDRIRRWAAEMGEDYRDRWRWHGQLKRGFYLSTEAHGRLFVMGSRRLGMNSAQPTFAHKRDGDKHYLMTDANDLGVREVPYRDDIVRFDNPYASWIAGCSPNRILALIAVFDAAANMEQSAHDFAPIPGADLLSVALEQVRNTE